MKRFFFSPLLAMLILFAGCACQAGGSITTPTKEPSAKPTVSASPTATAAPIATMPTETTAPVVPTVPAASPSANTTAGN